MYSSLAHAPKSISLHRSLQKGRCGLLCHVQGLWQREQGMMMGVESANDIKQAQDICGVTGQAVDIKILGRHC